MIEQNEQLVRENKRLKAQLETARQGHYRAQAAIARAGRPQIREAFLRNGARIEPGRDDLPDWVYEAAFELMESVIQSGQPAIQQTCDASFVDDYYGRVFDDTVSRAIGRIERSRK